MKRTKFLLIIYFTILSNTIFASNYPQAKFGEFGIQYHKTLLEYQNHYIGKTVTYIKGITRNSEYYDNTFIKAGGDFSKEYVITKIKGDDYNLTFTLKEKYGKKKIKIYIRNGENHNLAIRNYFYCITPYYSLPLILTEKFNQKRKEYQEYKIFNYQLKDLIITNNTEDYPSICYKFINIENNLTVNCDINKIKEFTKASEFVGKIYPSAEAPIHYKVINFRFNQSESNEQQILLTLQNSQDKEDIIDYDSQYLNDFNLLGKKITNTIFKCHYTIIGTQRIQERLMYIVENSINKKKKVIAASNAEREAFSGDSDGNFSAKLINVEKPSNPEIRYGQQTSVADSILTKYRYTDNIIDITIFANQDNFSFEMKNISANTIKIVWDEAVFVNNEGEISKVMHQGIKYSEKGNNQPASVIIKNAKLDDIIIPTNNVFYNEIKKEWDYYSLFRDAFKVQVGQSFRIMLPIQIKDVINEYIFEFAITYEYKYPELINITI